VDYRSKIGWDKMDCFENIRFNDSKWRLFVSFLSIASLMSLLFCASCSSDAPVRVDSEAEGLKIGALLSLSGDAAFFGDTELDAVKMAVEEANADAKDGQNISLLVEDIGTLNTADAITAMNKLRDIEGVFAAVGPTWDMAGLSETAGSERFLMVSSSNSEGVEASVDFPYHYVTLHPTKAETKALAKFVKSRGVSRVAVMRDQDPFSSSMAANFMESAKTEGLEIDEIITQNGDSDFRTPLMKMMDGKPEAIFACFATEEPRGPLVKQMKELGIRIPVLGPSSVETPTMLKDYGQYVDGMIYYAYPRFTQVQKEFDERYRAKYGKYPSAPVAANAYDAATILISALRSGAKDADEVKRFLDGDEFPSVAFGKLKFDSKGYPTLDSVSIDIKTIKDNEYIVAEK